MIRKIYILSILLFSTLLCVAQDAPLGKSLIKAAPHSTGTIKYKATRLNNSEPILTQAMFTDAGAEEEGHNMNGPSVIRIPEWITAENRADSEATYYCYFADHGGAYIRMAWAADIEGPWHLYDIGSDISVGDRGVLDLGGDVINLDNDIVIPNNHLASPDAHVDNDNQRIILYFHSGSSTYVDGEEVNKQLTYVSFSPFGLEFYENIQPVFLGDSYFRVFRYEDNLYALTNAGNPYRALDASNPWTAPDGFDYTNKLWEKLSFNPFQNDITEIDGLPSSVLRVRHTSVRVNGDILEVFYSRRGDLLENIQMSTVDLSVGDWSLWDATYPPTQILQSTPGWEGGELTPANSEMGGAPEDVNQLRDPYVFEDSNDSLYLFYTGRGEDAIGLARLTVSYEKPAAPSSLEASALSSSSIKLNWTANGLEDSFSIDRKLEGGEYEVIASMNANVISYTDTSLESSTSYTYRVYASNSQGNSDYSNEATAKTYSSDFVISTYNAIEDTYVRGGTYADTNFGTESILEVKTGNQEDYFRRCFVKFDLSAEDFQDKNIVGAVLRLYANKADPCILTASEADINWTETDLTWNSAPGSGDSISSANISISGLYYEWDVRAYLESQLEQDGILSIIIEDLAAASANVAFNSKEAVNMHPELVISTDTLEINTRNKHSVIYANESKVNIYPNPARDILNITAEGSKINKLTIYSLTGQILYSESVTSNHKAINIEHLAKGIYLLNIERDSGSYTHKFIKTL